MNKRLQFTGGEGDVRLDQILFGADANYLALQAILLPYAVGTNPNFIISGCVVTVGGASPNNTWSLATGYIYLNGEILEVESDSGVFDSTTEFLAFSKTTTYRADGDKTFVDSTPRQTLQQNRGTITVQGSVAVNELDAINGDTLILKIPQSIGLVTKIIDIGDWNMDTSNSVSVSHGLTVGNIRAIDVTIRDDAGTSLYRLNTFDNGQTNGDVIQISAGLVRLERLVSGIFDSTDFDSTSYNRGWITIQYIP